MARKLILVSDLSGKMMIDDEGNAVRITVTFADPKKPQYVVDAHADDTQVKELLQKGKKQARRGRRPKN